MMVTRTGLYRNSFALKRQPRTKNPPAPHNAQLGVPAPPAFQNMNAATAVNSNETILVLAFGLSRT